MPARCLGGRNQGCASRITGTTRPSWRGHSVRNAELPDVKASACAADFDQNHGMRFRDPSAYIITGHDPYLEYDHGTRDQARHGGGRRSRLRDRTAGVARDERARLSSVGNRPIGFDATEGSRLKVGGMASLRRGR